MRSMKTTIRVSVIAFVMLFAAGLFGVYGTMSVPAADQAYAANDEYTYTVTVYSGKEGYFDGNQNKHSKTLTKTAVYDEEITVDVDELGLTVIEPNKYYPRGVKRAGHDNDEVSQMTIVSYTFNVTKDEAFTVAYGMKGGMVKYTVKYVDKNGKELLSSKDYYGMAGDKPVVSCKYIEGYMPDDQNLTKTLSGNESDNVFTFTYHKAEGVAAGEEGNEDNAGDNDNNGGNNGANGGANAGNGGNAAGNGPATANIGDNATPMANVTDLDDNDTPMAPGDEDKEDGISGALMGLIGIVIAGILIALGLLYLILRRRGEEEEQE